MVTTNKKQRQSATSQQEKLERRRASNRESARKSRYRELVMVQELKKAAIEWTEKNEKIDAENQNLKKVISTIKSVKSENINNLQTMQPATSKPSSHSENSEKPKSSDPTEIQGVVEPEFLQQQIPFQSCALQQSPQQSSNPAKQLQSLQEQHTNSVTQISTDTNANRFSVHSAPSSIQLEVTKPKVNDMMIPQMVQTLASQQVNVKNSIAEQLAVSSNLSPQSQMHCRLNAQPETLTSMYASSQVQQSNPIVAACTEQINDMTKNIDQGKLVDLVLAQLLNKQQVPIQPEVQQQQQNSQMDAQILLQANLLVVEAIENPTDRINLKTLQQAGLIASKLFQSGLLSNILPS